MGKPPEKRIYQFLLVVCFLGLGSNGTIGQLLDSEYGCPPQEKILPCRCSTRDMEFQIWCSHSELPKVLEGLDAVSHYVARPIDEIILENNNLPSLPGKVFANLRVVRLMLRNNRLERVSSGWLDGLYDSLLELFIVEPDLRSLPVDSLDNLSGLEAITLQSRSMKRLPKFSGLPKLRYLQINSPSLAELTPGYFRNLPSLEQFHIFGSQRLTRLESGLLQDLQSLSLVNISECAINWIHPRAVIGLPELKEISLVGNAIADATMVGRTIIDLPRLSILRLDRNHISRLGEASFVELPTLSELYLSRNRISEIFPGAFHRVPMLRTIDLNHNAIHRIHPEFFIQRNGGLEELWLINNDLGHITELRTILDALPNLKFLDMSYNQLEEIPFGAIRGHSTLERLHLDHNRINMVQMEAFVALPALRELRLRNNSLSNMLEGPLWNLPALKGLDLAENYFRMLEPRLLANLPSLRRLDISGNAIGIVDPASFLANPALEHVNLSGNALAMIHPRTFEHLVNLYELDLGWNRLFEIVPGLPRNLEYLYMPMNQILNLPMPSSPYLALPALRLLDLSANGIKRLPPGSLSTLPNLKRLKLGYNALQHMEDGAFDGLSRMEQLDLRDNRLVSLHGSCLRGLRMLVDLNLRGNRLELIRPDLFESNARLQRLDLTRNRLAQIPHTAFANTRDLREVYASHNALTELPRSLHGLTALQVLDLSFNKLNILSPETLSSLTSLLELRLVKNKIQELREGAFNRLPRLSLIDLENNDLQIVERNAIRALPELIALRLGQNRLQMIPNGAFVELPRLQSAELQENRIEEISNNAFINVPQLLFLNLSHNLLPSLENSGLENLNSLEVLDLSHNRVARVSSKSLAAMEWLVELKIDNNRICAIQGSPFDDMPRLRVLSLRHNRMASVAENAFKRLRSNIAILDIDGNPLSCACGMLWLRGWLQQASAEGPRCADGSLFREVRLSRQDCQRERQIEPTVPGCEAEMIDATSLFGTSQVNSAWMNLQGSTTPLHPLPNESEYFYDEYVDYPYENASTMTPDNSSDTVTTIASAEELASLQMTSETPSVVTGGTPTIYAATGSGAANIINRTTLMPTKDVPPSPSSSGFTFFGVPLPSLNFNLWGNSGRKADRKSDSFNQPGRGRIHLFPPTEPEIHRGGFVPLPRGQSGFIPIVDPQLRYQMETNRSAYFSNKNVTIQKESQNSGFQLSQTQTAKYSTSSDGSHRPQNRTEKLPDRNRGEKNTSKLQGLTLSVKEQSNVTVPSLLTSKDFRGFSINVTKDVNITSSSEKVTKKLEIDQTSVPSEINEEENLHSMTNENGANGEVASKIVWTTPSSSTTQLLNISSAEDNKAPTTVRASIASIRDKSSFWNFRDWLKPKQAVQSGLITTVMPDDLEATGSPVTTTEHETILTTIHPGMPYMISMTRDKEASPLSALLVPGGQIPPYRPLGRSTITKVSSPSLTPVAEQYQNNQMSPELEKLLPEYLLNNNEKEADKDKFSKDDTTPKLMEQINGNDDNVRIIEDSSFNWYFQHYNDTILEPYVGLVDSGADHVKILITLSPVTYLIICRLM
ncbi:protein artichoke [Neodiprion lecontei]|uniref:Protein artichoke n=1 Tax=Neodiprion lecontei TaxID=441921 RepID=A0A6J0BRU1_NEOLC|nr:protein artichoke [Neodiprion lecontei]